MDPLTKLWDLIKSKLVKKEDITDEDMKAIDDALKAVPTQVPPAVPPSTSPEVKAVLEQNTLLSAQVKELTDMLKKQAEESTNAKKALEAEAKKQAEARKAELFKKAVDSGVLAPQDEDAKKNWDALYEANPEVTARQLEAEIKKITGQAQQDAQGQQGTSQAAGQAQATTTQTDLRAKAVAAIQNKIK